MGIEKERRMGRSKNMVNKGRKRARKGGRCEKRREEVW